MAAILNIWSVPLERCRSQGPAKADERLTRLATPPAKSPTWESPFDTARLPTKSVSRALTKTGAHCHTRGRPSSAPMQSGPPPLAGFDVVFSC